MSEITDLHELIVENRNAINTINTDAKQTGDFIVADTLTGTEIVRIMQGGVSKQTDADNLKNLGGTGEDNVQSDWNDADTGSDAHILSKPENLSDFNNDIGAGGEEANVQADWDETDNLDDAFIKNKPSITQGDWIEIDDAFVYKGANTNKSAIEAGDMIKRYPTTSRYIHARVDALPYTTDSNLSFFTDSNLL